MIRSVEAGPCPECGYTWQAHPEPATAICPRCASYSVGADNSNTLRVEVPDLDAVQ